MIIVNETKGLGKDSNGKTVTWFKFTCDTIADLPLPNYFSSLNAVIAQGSEADIIDPKSSYKMKSDGTWVIQDVGNDYYSKAETDDLLDDKADKATTYTKVETDARIAAENFCSVGITIPANSDLNTYTTKGVYNCGATNAATLSNCPVSAGFRLEVVEIAFSSRHQQRLYTQQVSGDSFYIRTEGGSGYGSWYKFTGTVVT